MTRLLLSLLLLGAMNLYGQDKYFSEIHAFRKQHYEVDLLTSGKPPIQKEDLKFLDFYPPNPAYIVEVTFEPAKELVSIDLPRVNGEETNFMYMGDLVFELDKQSHRLKIYSPTVMKKNQESYIFLGFKDLTTDEETFGGGRYLDISFDDIKKRTFKLDFNKSYNPWCAYSTGYRCLLIPSDNYMDVAIKAGEKNFKKPVSAH